VSWQQQVSRHASTSTCVATHGAFAAEAGSAEPWQLQCAQLKSDKSLLSSRLHAAEAAASDAAAELKHAREAAEAASEEIQMSKAEVQELRHQGYRLLLQRTAYVTRHTLQVSQQQHFASEKERALQVTKPKVSDNAVLSESP
jgi:chromosome segregation ATPase